MGYTLSGDASEKCFYILFGQKDTGKTTFVETVRAVAGDYAKTAARQTILMRRGSSDNVPDDVHRLQGARLIVVSETEEGDRLAAGMIKVFTGNAHQSTRALYGEWEDWLPQGKFWLDTNHKPRISGGDDAMWERVRLIPFEVHLPSKVGTVDRHFRTDKLVPELPGILAWAVEGVRLWQHEGLGRPLAVSEATVAYHDEEDKLAAFVKETCVVDPGERVPKKAFYDAFRAWYREHVSEDRKYMMGKSRIKSQLLGLGFGEARDGVARYWTGIGLRDEYDPWQRH